MLDQRTFWTYQPYSFPRGTIVSCDSGKPYHFWMSAFLAHRSSLRIEDPWSSGWSAYLADVGYQVFSHTAGRDPNRAFEIVPLAVPNQKIRIDLSYAAAGAMYGSKSQNRSREIDIDAMLNRLIDAAEPVPRLSQDLILDSGNREKLELIFRWKRIFHPEVAFPADTE